MDIKLTRIPTFLEASSKEELIELMLRNNIESGRAYEYRDIQFADGSWVAWYIKDLQDELLAGDFDE